MAFFAVLPVSVMAIALAGVAQQAPTEAPAGFDTPTLAQNPGSNSLSNASPYLQGTAMR
jgi:hypothetical protein